MFVKTQCIINDTPTYLTEDLERADYVQGTKDWWREWAIMLSVIWVIHSNDMHLLHAPHICTSYVCAPHVCTLYTYVHTYIKFPCRYFHKTNYDDGIRNHVTAVESERGCRYPIQPFRSRNCMRLRVVKIYNWASANSTSGAFVLLM